MLGVVKALPVMEKPFARVDMPTMTFQAIVSENQRLIEANNRLRSRGTKAPDDAVERLEHMGSRELTALLTEISKRFRESSWEAAIITEAAGRVLDLEDLQQKS